MTPKYEKTATPLSIQVSQIEKCSIEGKSSSTRQKICSRCGKPLARVCASVVGRETVLLTMRPSWWHFLADFLIVVDLLAGGLYLLVHGISTIFGALLLIAGFTVGALVIFAGEHTTWTLSSERLIACCGLFSKTNREITLTNTRSINIVCSPLQKLFGIGSVAVASISDADFQILIDDIQNPD